MPSADFAHTFLNKFIGSQALMPEQKQKGFPTMMPGPQSPAPSSYPSFQDYGNFQSEQKQKGFPTMMPGPQSPAPSSYPSFGPRVDPTAGASTYQRSFQDYANFR